MGKTDIKKYIQARYDKINDGMAEDMSTNDYYELKGRLAEVENFASNFGVKLKRVPNILSTDNVDG